MILKDKVAMITGGGRGIGREIAVAFAKEGCDLALCDVNADFLAETLAGRWLLAYWTLQRPTR